MINKDSRGKHEVQYLDPKQITLNTIMERKLAGVALVRHFITRLLLSSLISSFFSFGTIGTAG